jgi:phosphohistidine phosphatase
LGARRLTLLRHGHAESPDLWPEDFERPLTKRGSTEVQEMAQRLVQREWIPDLILVSPAERTWATAQIVAAACELEETQLHCVRELYLATAETIWQLVSRQSASTQHILICGHNPGLSALASGFGHPPRTRELPTAGVAMTQWPDTHWNALSPRSALTCELDDPEKQADD